MSPETIFWIVTAVVTALTVGLVSRFISRRLPPATRRLAFGIIGVLVLLAILHAYADLRDELNGRLWLLNANADWTIPTIFSSAELLMVTVAAWAVGFWLDDRWDTIWQKLFWLGFGFVFLYIAVDDYFAIHENWSNLFRRTLLAVAGLGIAAAAVVVFRPKLRSDRSLFTPLVIGIVVTTFMGALFERYVVWRLACRNPLEVIGHICDEFHYYEEFGEFAGVTIILLALVAYLEQYARPQRWRQALTAGGGVAALGAALMAANIWLLPALEARFWATPAQVTYLDGDLSLIGYRLEPGLHHPGDRVAVTLYWRANRKLDKNVGLSLHLVTPDDYQSMYQVNLLNVGRYPTAAWPTGSVERGVVRLEIPSDLDAPVGYLLTVTPWLRGGEVTLVESDRLVLRPPTIGLDYVPLLGPTPPPDPAQAAAIDFAGEFTLTGYDLPAEISPGESLTVALWWQVAADVRQEYVQFFHIIGPAGELAAAWDALPFAGDFPTQSWRAGMRFVEPVSIPLPADLAPGAYQVYTSMYTLPDVIRVPLTSAGEPVPDNLVPLGSVRIVQGS